MDDNELEAQRLHDQRRNELDAAKAPLEAEIKEWKKAIEGLTPSGSEFVNDPKACAEYIRRRTNYPKMIIDLRAENERLRDGISLILTDLDSFCDGIVWRMRLESLLNPTPETKGGEE